MMPQRLSSMHSKVRQIHIQLQQPASSNAAEEQPSSSNNKGPLLKLAAKLAGKDGLRCCLRKQLFFAQCLKLLALFSVAIAHVLFLHPFLELFSQLDEYMARVDVAIRQQPPPTSGVGGANLLRHSVHDLADYKKNVWMTVSVLCVALSTSSFFLFLLPSSSPLRKRYIYLIGLVDAVSFGCLPILFHARAFIVQRVRERLSHALVEAHRISSAEKLMNEAQCSIQPREKMPFCSERILLSVFPVDLLKFLLVLCVMTLAYLLVAYIIYWCVKHWVPHNDANCTKFCHCCISQHKKSLLAANYTPLGQFDFPRPLVLLPNPLMAVSSTQCSPASQTQDEESTEPVPTIVTN